MTRGGLPLTEIPLITSSLDDHYDAMVMTGAAYNAAERIHVTAVEADVEAMAAIAAHVGAIPEASAIHVPPQFFVVRDASPGRALIGNWDTRTPSGASSPATERYFWATDLDSSRPRTSERARLTVMAHSIGASALTELTVANWDDTAALAGTYATGLLFGQRPVDPSDAPSLGARLFQDVRDSLKGRTTKRLRLVQEINEMAKAENPDIAPPFVVHHRTKNQLEEA